MSAFSYMKNDERESVLEVVFDVHTHTTGSGENQHQERDVKLLHKIADNWDPSLLRKDSQRSIVHARFDDAVLSLIRATIEEHDAINGS